MKCSICIATYNKPEALQKTLESIASQQPSFHWEVIVVDDGSPERDTYNVCNRFGIVRYMRVDREPGYRNPAVARNIAYREAKGEVIICQSDDVIHHSPDAIESLVSTLRPGTFVLATVINVDADGIAYRDLEGRGYGDQLMIYVSPKRRRPLFFLGALYRRDLYLVGGNDEEFVDPSGEDQWFALCLTKGLKLKPYYSSEIIGHHQCHTHCTDYTAIARSQKLLKQLRAQSPIVSIGERAWKYTDSEVV